MKERRQKGVTLELAHVSWEVPAAYFCFSKIFPVGKRRCGKAENGKLAY